MKKYLIYLACVLGLCTVFGGLSRLSSGFSEWYAVTVYPIIVGVIGRVFGILPFSAAEFLLILLILGGITEIVLLIIVFIKSKHDRYIRKAVLAKAGVCIACVASTILLIYITNCGINYNRHTFLYDKELSFKRSMSDEWLVYLTLLDEFYTFFPDDISSQIVTDDNGVFVLNGDIKVTAPAAMRSLAEKYPRLNVYFPRPKPIMLSELMTHASLLGVYIPLTVEANYNRIAPDSEIAFSALHELAHVAGFMREDEANFIAFLAGKESGNPELIYAAYLDVLQKFSLELDSEMYENMPDKYKVMLDGFIAKSNKAEWTEDGFFYGTELVPEQIMNDWWAESSFWWERWSRSNIVIDAINDISTAANDTYLKIQGAEDGVESYGRMFDLVIAFYLSEL